MMAIKSNKFLKAFTLMELMVVVVIIGILAAVGSAMFRGPTDKAMMNSTKAIDKQMTTYITVEMMNCSMGETTTMNGNLTCSGRSAASVVAAAVTSQANEQKNPFENDKAAVTSGGNNTAESDAGYIRLSVSGTDIVVKSCHTKPCDTVAMRQEKKIPFQ
jgi:prepilin-type N-terminal cleavage/methylation domain-containing protein